MQGQNDLAINLLDLFKPSSYKEFKEGFFINKPKMRGYYFIFKNIRKPKFCLLLNTNKDFVYPSNMTKIDEFVYIVFNVSTLEEFLENLTDKYFLPLMDIIDNEIEKKNERNLPYGYYLDENGELKIDLRKANEVRKIYDLYLEVKSAREVASQMNTNFSKIREILHNNEEYMQMREKIVPLSKLREVGELLAGNVKGGAVAKRSLEDEIREIRQKRKQSKRSLQQMQ